MASKIPVILGLGYSKPTWNGGTANAYVFMAGGQGASQSGENLNWVAVFDRKNPTGGPVFTAAAPNNTTVPDGLAQYLTDDYLMFWASGCFVHSMPQGALFTMLQENGGGIGLERMETMTTQLACGINANVVYLLATVPGSSGLGYEHLEVQGRSGTDSYAGGEAVTSFKTSPYMLMLDLMPSDDGVYTPILIGA